MAKTTSMIRARLGNIELIRDGSTSPLVAGDNAAIGSQYFGPGGEQWTKVGSTATAWAQQLMRAPYFNVKTYGAVGDGVTDDRLAIQAAIDAAIGQGGGVVFFPVGTYGVEVRLGVVNSFTLSTAAQGKLLFMGEGRASQIYQFGDAGGGDTRLIDITLGCKYVGFKSICLDGSGITDPNEQAHLLHFTNTNATLDDETGRCFVSDVYFNHVNGDGIRVLGNLTHLVKSVLIERCVFQMETAGGQGARSCIAFQRSVDDIFIDCCYMTGSDDQVIDFEPTGNGSNRNNHIDRNYLDGFVALSGNGAEAHKRSTFCWNTIVGGSITGLDVQNMVLSGNVSLWNLVASVSDSCIGLVERIKNVVVANNMLARENLTAIADVIAIDVHTVAECENVQISNNLCLNNTNLDGGFGVTVRDTDRVIIVGNQFYVMVNTALEGGIVRLEGVTADLTDVVVNGNLGVATASIVDAGVTAGGAALLDFGNTAICDNLFRNINRGINFPTGGNPTEQVLASRNILASTTSAVVRSGGSTLPVPIDAAASLTGAGILQLLASPVLTVDAAQGTIGLRSTGGGQASTLYIKELP